ncbi:SDR family NAD(P)-dependent oxidoreductase [Nocardia tengchongensis]|uniref:SDR family NAD(P)-dependent oxidoreductase n=1 Tax=Nocardia tengchongensis TaxID=2055889 RepID=UPI0036BD5761
MSDFGHRAGAALILGASGGLGGACARMLLERGSDVALTYFRSPSSLDGLLTAAAETGRRARTWQLDLSDADQTGEVVAQAAAEFGGLHTLVYAAGPHVPMRHLSKVAPADFRGQILDDVSGFFNAVHAVLPHLRESKGSIVAITTAGTARFPVRDGWSRAPH